MEIKKKSGIFYGWWILIACFIMATYSSGVIYYGFTALFEPVVKEFGWSYAEVSFASSLRGLEIGLFAPVVGYLVDRFGARPVLFIGGIFSGVGVLILSRINTLLMFYAAFGFISIGLSACGSVVMLAAVARWFHRRASLVIGILTSGFGFSGMMVPVVVWFIDTFGWRQAMSILGIGVFIVILPLSLLIRRTPEQYGLLPDGDQAATPDSSVRRHASSVRSDVNLTWKEALACPTFWFISIAMALQHLLSGALTTHIMPYLSSVGVTRDIAGLAATGIPVISIVGRFGFGWSGDRISNKWLSAAGFAMLGIGLAAFVYVGPGVLLTLIFAVAIFGIGFGGTNTMRAVITRTCFGTANFATIFGLVAGVGTAGSLIGPPLAGYVYDTIGDYRPVWAAFIVLCVLCFGIMAFMPPAKAPLRVKELNGKPPEVG